MGFCLGLGATGATNIAKDTKRNVLRARPALGVKGTERHLPGSVVPPPHGRLLPLHPQQAAHASCRKVLTATVGLWAHSLQSTPRCAQDEPGAVPSQQLNHQMAVCLLMNEREGAAQHFRLLCAGKRRHSRVELLTLLQLPYNSSREISSHRQYVGSQLEILTTLRPC